MCVVIHIQPLWGWDDDMIVLGYSYSTTLWLVGFMICHRIKTPKGLNMNRIDLILCNKIPTPRGGNMNRIG